MQAAPGQGDSCRTSRSLVDANSALRADEPHGPGARREPRAQTAKELGSFHDLAGAVQPACNRE